MRSVCTITMGTLLALSCGSAVAQSDTRARDLASTCANCHGTSGKAQGAVPALAGQSRSDLVQKMNDFRDGKRPATIMHQLAKGYTPEQIDALAGWFAQQKP
jgi:cytochrome subunit of sulfide dehydrogenase